MSEQEEILTTEEMSALLPETGSDEASREEKKRRVVPFNFRRPDRLSKEQVRSLYLLHDLFADALSSNLPLFLRAASDVNLISVEQQSYADYLRGLSDPTTIFTIDTGPSNGVLAIELNSTLAFPVIDRMLGGEGEELSEQRPATDLELKILEGFLTLVIENYRDTWKTVAELETRIVGRETRPQLVQIVPLNEIVATVVYQVQIGESKGLMSICLPVGMLEPVISNFNRSSYSSEHLTSEDETSAILDAVSGAKFEIAAEFAPVPAAVADLMQLSIGDVLRTNHRLGRPVNLSLGGSVKFAGRLGTSGETALVEISEVCADGRATSNSN